MNKFLPLITLFVAAFMMSTCSPPGIPAQSTVSTLPPTNVTYSPPSTPTLPLANVTCNELTFYLDPALGNGYDCETVPERSNSDLPEGMSYVFIYPTHTELTIQHYPLTHTQFPPQIWIYPVSRFSELLPNIIPPLVYDLERLITGSTWSRGELPFLPFNPQIQSFVIHETGISFNGGQGVRFITEYTDGPSPISNLNIIYTFQGLTDNEMYWVAVTFPISNPILPADYDTLPEGYTQESLILNYSSYVSDVKYALEAQAPGSFSPTIEILDSLVNSITVSQ